MGNRGPPLIAQRKMFNFVVRKLFNTKKIFYVTGFSCGLVAKKNGVFKALSYG